MSDFNIVIDFEEKESPEIGILAVKGKKGDRGLDGEPGPGITGISQNQDGTLTIHIADGTSYDTQPLKGADGEPGAKGDKGDKGDTGEKGEDGLPGADGKDGAKGEKGDKGDKGDTGATGAKGDKGDPGKDGADGLPGAKGDKGDKGDDGYTPIKGTDYWTASDKSEIIEEVVEEIDLSDYVQKTDYASSSNAGIVKVDSEYGLSMRSGANNNVIRTVSAAILDAKLGSHGFRGITPSVQHAAAFYGLAKAAGDTTQVSSSNAVGNYTDNAKTAINSMLGTVNASSIAPTENGTTASQAYAAGAYFFRNGAFCKALVAIASGARFTLNTNYIVTTVAAELFTALNA